MKFNNIIAYISIGCLALTSCVDLDTTPEGGIITDDGKQDVIATLPERLSADVNGMFGYIARQGIIFPTNDPIRADDAGYPGVALSFDLNAADMVCMDSGYEWFTVSSQYEDRNANYANPYIRYALFYNQNKLANDILASIPEDTEDEQLLIYKGQALAVRAFDYLSLAPYFQFKYKGNEDKLCVPIVTFDMENAPENNPRATVREVYKLIMDDLNDAITLLDGYTRKSKSEIDQSVAYGLRARANLYMENWEDAASDADKAMSGYTPYTKEQVSKPTFHVASNQSYMWALIIEPSNIDYVLPTWPSQIGSFTGKGYTTGQGTYKMINSLLFNKISTTDVRKGWWVDENLHSANLATVSWNGVTGDAVASLSIPSVKKAFEPYTNVKFGVYEDTPGNTDNAGDWCMMRSEEMILIKAEATGMTNLSLGKQILEDFVKTHRDASFTSKATDAKSLQNEVWFQRRVELWGEGFAMADIMRLGKNVVRFNPNKESNFPEAFKFNIPADNGWLLMRFPQKETNNNKAIVDNSEGNIPVPESGSTLKDGITD